MYNSQLTTFVQVADSGSFNKAAEALYISSTAVIKQINALEKHLDLTLFSRTNHGIALTESGRIIYKHARKLFAYSEKAIAEARLAAAEAATTFCVGTSILNPCKPFMDLWYRVSEQLPGSTLSPLRTTTREFSGRSRPWGRSLTFSSVPATPDSGWTGAIFFPLECIVTAWPFPGNIL